MEILLEKVRNEFQNRSISTDVLLPNVKVVNLTSKDSPAFNDPKYLPFYYRLGCQVKVSNAIQIGSKLGLVGASFTKGCKSLEEWIVVENKSLNHRFVESNLKLCGCKKVVFFDFDSANNISPVKIDKKADIAFLSECFDSKQTDIYLDFLWNILKSDSFLVVDYLEDTQVSESFQKFCVIKNREPTLFKTRYGIGVLQK
jgi:hypothetical protein